MRGETEEWRDLMRPTWGALPVDEKESVVSSANVVHFGQVILSSTQHAPQLIVYDPEKVRAADRNYLLFERLASGYAKGNVGGVAADLGPSVLHLADLSRPIALKTSEMTSERILIPHVSVGYEPSRHPPHIVVPIGCARAQLLIHAHEAILMVSRKPNADHERLDYAFAALVRSLLLDGAKPALRPDNVTNKYELVKSYISRHLRDPDLSCTEVCQQCRLSRTAIYRLFADHGGVMRYITRMRLDRCFAELLETPKERGRVRAVAERWGFYDPASFHRRFRDRFQLRPSECLGAGAGAGRPATISVGSPQRPVLRQ